MSFTLFVLRVLPVYWYCKVSIAMLSFYCSTDLSTLHWDLSKILTPEQYLLISLFDPMLIANLKDG